MRKKRNAEARIAALPGLAPLDLLREHYKAFGWEPATLGRDQIIQRLTNHLLGLDPESDATTNTDEVASE